MTRGALSVIIRSFLILNFMKKDIHPKYYTDATITCSCGQKWTIGSTVEKLHVELCSKCHPFYTGKDKVMDAAGRVERFKARAAKTEAMKLKKAAPPKKKAAVKKKAVSKTKPKAKA